MARKNARSKRRCEHKKPYATQKEAARAAYDLAMSTGGRVRFRSYKCPEGKHWHVSHAVHAGGRFS